MNIDLGDCPSIPLTFTEEDEEGNRVGFGRMPDGNIVMISIEKETGCLAVMTNDQAFSLNAALERFEAGYEDESLSIATDGFTDREVNGNDSSSI